MAREIAEAAVGCLIVFALPVVLLILAGGAR